MSHQMRRENGDDAVLSPVPFCYRPDSRSALLSNPCRPTSTIIVNRIHWHPANTKERCFRMSQRRSTGSGAPLQSKWPTVRPPGRPQCVRSCKWRAEERSNQHRGGTRGASRKHQPRPPTKGLTVALIRAFDNWQREFAAPLPQNETVPGATTGRVLTLMIWGQRWRGSPQEEERHLSRASSPYSAAENEYQGPGN
jgi:hypothetical protein